MRDKKLLARAKKSLKLDVSNARAFKVEPFSGGFKVTAKTPKASAMLTEAHYATLGRER